jgi:hypothetical protein
MARDVPNARTVSIHPQSGQPLQHQRLTLADILLQGRDHLANGPLSAHPRNVLAKMAICRSGAYGYAKLACPDATCGHEEWRPRGCGLRHCPTCGQTRAQAWVEDRKLDMLECPYYQLVFSLPPDLAPLARSNPARIYGLFFDAVRDTLVELAADPKHLGGIPQVLLALHTWNGRLDYFVHIHALMAAGAYDPDADRWIPAKNKDFLFPVKVLSVLVRGKFLDTLKKLWRIGALSLEHATVKHLADPTTWGRFVDQLYATDFYTFVTKAIDGPELVIEYLGHYLQRAGLSNGRLVSSKDGNVTFLCKDRKKKYSTTGFYPREMPINDFIDLYAMHILPRNFHRVRFVGLWSARHKKLTPQAREAVRRWAAEHPDDAPKPIDYVPRPRKPELCPACGKHPLELKDSIIFIAEWRDVLYPPCGPRGPPRLATPRRRPA